MTSPWISQYKFSAPLDREVAQSSRCAEAARAAPVLITPDDGRPNEYLVYASDLAHLKSFFRTLGRAVFAYYVEGDSVPRVLALPEKGRPDVTSVEVPTAQIRAEIAQGCGALGEGERAETMNAALGEAFAKHSGAYQALSGQTGPVESARTGSAGAIFDSGPVVTLCGSARFENDFKEANRQLTLAGCVVFSLAVYPSEMSGQRTWYSVAEKAVLDLVHLRKIERSEAVLVVGASKYLGWSTSREILWARQPGKRLVDGRGFNEFSRTWPHLLAQLRKEAGCADDGPRLVREALARLQQPE